MAIFDANKTVYLSFYICLTDPVEVAAKQALYPEGVVRAPYNPGPPASGASIEFGAPFRGFTEPAAGTAPFTWTEWRSDDTSNKPFPLDVATFQRHTGGFWGMGGTTIRYYWLGTFKLAADPAGGEGDPALEADIPARRFIEGFGTPRLGPAASFPTSDFLYSKDAARHVGGMGLAIRGASSATFAADLTEFGAAASPHSWERFYVRLRQLPTETVLFWGTSCLPSAGVGTWLGVTATGQLAIYTRNATSVFALVGVVPGDPLPVWSGAVDDETAWVRLDLLINVAGAGTGSSATDPLGTPASSFRVYRNGVLASSVGGVTATSHRFSKLGNPQIQAGNLLDLDVADWRNSAIPVRLDPDDSKYHEALNGKDWINGSKIVTLRATGFGADHSANWTGDFRLVLQNPWGNQGAGQVQLATSTPSAVAVVTTDDADQVDADAGSIGIAALEVLAYSIRGSLSGTLGYSLAGAAPVMAAIAQQTTNAANGVIVSAVTAAAEGEAPVFPDWTPIELRHAKGADASDAGLSTLVAQVELIGKWGVADYLPTDVADIAAPAEVGTGVHNSPYPKSPWAHVGAAAPISPYVVKGGTYVGNSTGQDLTFRAPVHFLYIRPVTGNLGGSLWWSSMLGSHRVFAQGSVSQIVDEQQDPAYTSADGEDAQQQAYRIRIAGAGTQLNATGVTYQYVAVCDPGMRFMLNATYAYNTGGDKVHPLVSPAFTPRFAFFFREDGGNTSTKQLSAKGPGQAAAALVSYQPAVLAAGLTFGTGEVTTGSDAHAICTGALSLWRSDDGSQDTELASAVNVGSYTGDGAASRTINLAPASGKRPLFAMIFAQSGTNGYQRDPSHTTTNSSTHGGTDVATGITAGAIDGFTVAVGANGNGIVYTYFVLLAGTAAGNNGWGTNGEYWPVEPTTPGPGGPWPTDPTEPPEEPGPEPGPTPGPGPSPNPWPGGPPNLPPDFSLECYAWSTYLGNVALSQIGVGKQIADIRTDASEEGYKIRLHYALGMEQALRDHPWPFATRYADLVLVAGTATVPVNLDWQYSYRAPADMAFARRLVSQIGAQRAHDPDPPLFRVGSDATGALLYTNAVASSETPVQLEYTLRLSCPAQSGDAIFRTAFMWKLAASLALSLARDAKKAEYCETAYQQTLALARATGAKEQQQAPAGDPDWITERE